MRQEQMDRDLLLEARQSLHVCFVWRHRCHCIIAMHLVSEMLGLIVRLYIRFHRIGSYNVYIINIIDNMHLICNWKGVREGGQVRGSTASMIQKKILGFTIIYFKLQSSAFYPNFQFFDIQEFLFSHHNIHNYSKQESSWLFWTPLRIPLPYIEASP